MIHVSFARLMKLSDLALITRIIYYVRVLRTCIIIKYGGGQSG